MNLYCKNCGSEIESIDGQKIAVCEFCGMEQTLPTANDPQKMELFVKANDYRRACRFDLAKKQYESIIAQYPDDNEAYWCKLLCVYGIEYVDDDLTEKKLPTCHRTVTESVFDNKDYKLIMSRASAEEKAIYEAEAKEIDRIQKEILSSAQQQEPFDVFICYKESDENGRRTRDSQIANRIYSNLTSKGYKVFFSHVTLKELAGSKYESVIYSALTTAKVMLVVTTSKEYVNAPWVRNEWSRFLEFMQSDYTKTIVPCISVMDAYELPEELVDFQALNTADMDFTETLTRQIDSKFGKASTLKREEPVTVTQTRTEENATQTTNNSNIQPLLKRINIFLLSNDWDKADEYAEKVLDIDPECSEAYLGKLLAEQKIQNKEQLKDCEKPFDNSKTYQMLMMFANETLKQEINGYIDYIKERNENARKQGIYEQATKRMLGAKTDIEYKEAGKIFESIIDWKDSREQIEYCEKRIAEIKAKREAERIAAEQERKRCEELVKSLDTAKSKEEIEKIRKQAQAELEELGKKKKELEEIKERLPIIQPQIVAIENELKELESRISALILEKSKLGFFAMKRKKEIDAEIKGIESNKKEKEINKDNLNKELNGYTTITAIEKDVEKCGQQIEEAKVRVEESKALLAKEEIIAKLKQSEIGVKLYESTDEYKKEQIRNELSKAEVGVTVKFGKYYQNNDTTKEDIEWQVLKTEGNRALLISKYALDCKRYNTSNTNVTWEICSLRKWLNNEFINSAFSETEKAMIPTVLVSADKNPSYSTNPGKATQDKVFLLSIPEANKYFSSNTVRQCKPTAYIKKQGAYVNDGNGNCVWWLRSPGDNQDYATRVYDDGNVYYSGTYVYNNNAVRPALWVNLEL